MPLGAFRLNGLASRIIEAAPSRTAVSVTVNGDAQIDTAQSQFGGASALFDGTADWLNIGTIPNQTNTDDFSIEGWVRFNSLPSVWAMFTGASSSTYIGVRNFSGTYALGGAVTGGSGTFFKNMVIPTAPTTGVWYHWAMTKSGGNLYHFWDGDLLTTVNNSSGSMSSDKGWSQLNRVGNWFNSTDYTVNGHLDELRFSNTARYTATFTPPTEPFVNDANTLLLLHMDGTDASTDFFDDNGARAKVGVSAVGNAQVDTAQSQFGGSSALFDGSGDYLNTSLFETPSATDPYTIEGWIRRNVDSGTFEYWAQKGWPDASVSNRSWFWGVDGSDKFVFIYAFGGSSTVRSGTTSLATGTWYHVAVSNDGTTTRMFVNGTQENSWSSLSINSGSNYAVRIGAHINGTTSNVNGHLDEFRISNTARYTANFTPSSTAFTNDANTLLLLHMDGTDGSTTFTDDNS